MYCMEIIKHGFIILIGVVVMIVVFHTQHVPCCRNCSAGTVENWDSMGTVHCR
jgi:hypothetical protein